MSKNELFVCEVYLWISNKLSGYRIIIFIIIHYIYWINIIGYMNAWWFCGVSFVEDKR